MRPRCPHFGLHAGACGGCKMQHLTRRRRWRQAARAGGQPLAPGQGQARAACCGRSKGRPGATASARGCRCATCVKKGTVLVGFHERKSSYVADMPRLPRAAARTSATLLMPLRELIGSMDARDDLPQIELARCGDGGVTALVLRHLEPLSDGRPGAAARLRARAHGVQWWLQPKGPDTVAAARRGRRGAGLRAARVRRHDAVQADRLHAGQPAHQPRAGGARAAPAGRAAATSA